MADMYLPDDGDSSLGQADIVWVAQSKLLTRGELPPGSVSGVVPAIGMTTGSRSQLWPVTRAEEEVWIHGLNTVGVVISPDCAIDKDMHRVATHLMATEGLDEDAAYDRAQAEAEFFVQVAELRCVSDLPAHQQGEVGKLGLVAMESFPGAPSGSGPFVIDFSRITTVSNRIIERRMALATPAMKHRLQAALCMHFAARNVELSVALTQLFARPVLKVDSLVAPDPGKGKGTMRVRVHFDDGKSAVVEARLTPEDLSDVPGAPLIQRKT
ncbi:MAG: hypothetical protein VKP72_01900 [bacterium]|nr:hypothetical protein [bacterium]